jgi:hypothetical protein
MAVMIAIRRKFRGFKPGQKQRIFKGDEIRSTTSFGREVKLLTPCRKILRHVKQNLEGMKRDICTKSFPTLSPSFFPLCYWVSLI